MVRVVREPPGTLDETTPETEDPPLVPSIGPPSEGPSDVGPDATEARAAKRGDVIGGRYLVEGTIARGGMGRVLQVRHSELGKPFALKLPSRRRLVSPAVRERFQREAKLASSLSHENIVSVIDFGDDPDFGVFMVMELLEGVRLDHKLRRDGGMAPRVACDVVGQVAEALRYIHGSGLVHGDVKSENILVNRNADRRRVIKLLDFGLARTEETVSTGRIEGTPEYMAPERVNGGAPTMAGDIYSLGILFWECLVGELPFTGMRDVVFDYHRRGRLPPPSSQIPDRALDERADLLVGRATAKDPADRHPDVSSFLYELRTLAGMLSAETGHRRRMEARGSGPVRTERGQSPAAEVFDSAPVPLAAVDVRGSVRIANRAFLTFLGHPGDGGGLSLGETGLLDLYPRLLDDLQLAASEHHTVKHILSVPDSDGGSIDTAVILTPGREGTDSDPTPEPIVYVTLHPLGSGFRTGTSRPG
jgi:PAS domain-containing protein